MEGANAVEIDGLGRRFGSLEAVKGIRLAVREGETLGLRDRKDDIVYGYSGGICLGAGNRLYEFSD